MNRCISRRCQLISGPDFWQLVNVCLGGRISKGKIRTANPLLSDYTQRFDL
jgi:hypothetical protein